MTIGARLSFRWRSLSAARQRKLAALAVGSLAGILAVLFYSSTWRTGDDGRYYTLGLSIANGAGLSQYWHPEQPPETLTPPLYPALVAAVVRTTAQPVAWVKRLGNVLFVLAAGLVVLVLAGKERPTPAVVLGAGMGMGAVGFVSFASFIMADMLFVLLAYATLWMASQDRRGGWAAFILGCCGGLACLTRTAGLALAAAFLLQALIRREWRNLLLVGLGLGLVVAPWYYWKTWCVPAASSYVSFADLWARIYRGQSLKEHFAWIMATEIVRDVPTYLLAVIPRHFFYNAEEIAFGSRWWNLAGNLVGLVAAAGFLLRARRGNAVDFFFVFSLLLIAATPGPIYDKSYFFPLFPIYAFCFFHALEWLALRWGRRPQGRWPARAVWAGALGVFCFSLMLDFGAGAVHFIKENPRRPHGPWAPARFLAFHNEYDDAWARASEAAAWMQANTPADALLLSRKPDHLFAMSGRRGWRYDIPKEVGCTGIMEAVGKYAASRPIYLLEDAFPTGDFIFTYGNNREYVLNETVRKFPDRWRLVLTTSAPATRVWAYAGKAESTAEQ